VPFDLSMWKLAALGVIAMIVFGPEKLPEIARDAGRMLRQLRGMAQAAKAELQTEIGDTLGEFDISELNPKTFVRKHLFEDDDILGTSPKAAPAAAAWTPPAATAPAPVATLEFGVPAPYDLDAT
jgi:sec-independent protein translocase protein TatB